MPNNPYLQVALMYLLQLRRPGVIWLVAAYSLVLLGGALTRSPGAAVPALMMAPYLLLPVAGLIIWPFVSWQAHLTPGFRRTHAIVVTVAVLLLIVALPAVIGVLVDRSALAAVAITVFLFAAILYSLANDTASQGPPIFWVVFLAAMLLPAAGIHVAPLQQAFVLYFTGSLEPVAIGALFIGLVMIGLAARQLARVDGEASGEDGLRLFLQGWGLKRQGVSPWKDLDSKAFERSNRLTGADGRVTRSIEHAQHASSSRWSSVCRWRVGMPDGWWSWLFGSAVVLAIQLVAWPIANGRIGASASFGLSLLVWLIALPVIFSIGQFACHNWMLPFAMMLPVARHAYFRQTAVALAVSQFRMWSGMCLAFIASWITIRSEPLQPTILINVVFGSALTQIGLFGLAYLLAWLTYRYSLPMVGAIVGVFATVLLVVGAMAVPTLNVPLRAMLLHSTWPCIAAGVLTLLGLLATWFTYRRWLLTDIA